MNWIEALILGILQGLTEFLPVSSSGHLEIGKHLLNIEAADSMTFTVVVHGATVLSTIIVFRKDIWTLIKGLFAFSWNEETKYVAKIVLSMLPVLLIGLFLKDYVETLFDGNLLFVGFMLLITAILLAFTYYAKQKDKDISYRNAFLIGVSQAIAVIPGISRSGATIATALLLGSRKDDAAKFSFLMVIPPIIGANILDLLDTEATATDISSMALSVGFISAFVTGLLACTLMISLVKKGKLIYFAVYCAVVALIAIIFNLLTA